MKTYLVKEHALQTYKVGKEELDQLIEQNRIDTALVVDCDGTERLAVYGDDLAAYVADRDITPDKFAHFRGSNRGRVKIWRCAKNHFGMGQTRQDTHKGTR